MKAQTVILLAVVALLLVGSVALAQSGGPLGYGRVGEGIAFTNPGHYRLTSVTWQAQGIASGGGYRLAAPVSPTGTGTPCCCNYLPIILRNH